jgi:hypothetical protein
VIPAFPQRSRRPGAFPAEESPLSTAARLAATRPRGLAPLPTPGLGPQQGAPRPGLGPRRETEGSALRRNAFRGAASAGNQGRTPGPPRRNRTQPTSVGRDVSALPRFGKAGTPNSPRASGKNDTPCRPCRASAKQGLRKALGLDGTTAHAAPGRPTPLGGADSPRRGPRRRPTGASAPAKPTRTRCSKDGASAPPAPTRNLTAPPRRSSQEVLPRRVDITPRRNALDLPRKAEARRQHGPEGLAPLARRATGGRREPTPPRGGGPTEAAGAAAPPRRGDVASRASPWTPQPPFLGRTPGGPTPRPDRPIPLGGARSRTTGPTDQSPSGEREAGLARGLEARRPEHHRSSSEPHRRPATQPRRSSEHPRRPQTGTLARRHRPEGDPLGGHPTGTGTRRRTKATPSGATGTQQHRRRHATAQKATPSGATRQAPAPAAARRRPPRGPPERSSGRPTHRTRRLAARKD